MDKVYPIKTYYIVRVSCIYVHGIALSDRIASKLRAIGTVLPMFALFFALSTCKCPEGVLLRDMQLFTLNLSAKTFSYFFARVPTNQKYGVRMMVKSDKPAKVAAESIAVCANETTTPFIVAQGGTEWFKGQTFFRDPSVDVISIGIYSEEDQIIHVKMANPEPANYSKLITKQVFYVFCGLVVVAGLMFSFFIGNPFAGIKKLKTD